MIRYEVRPLSPENNSLLIIFDTITQIRYNDHTKVVRINTWSWAPSGMFMERCNAQSCADFMNKQWEKEKFKQDFLEHLR